MTKIEEIQRIIGTPVDGKWGPQSQKALDALISGIGQSSLPKTLGDGTWPWTAKIDGDDVVVDDCRMTCFGGSDDPQDGGETASGISTKDRPDLAACSLPMDGRMFPKLSKAEHGALDGSPIPRVPFKTMVRVTSKGKQIEIPVIDLGPGKRTGNALDLTLAAARLFDPKATATNFATRGSYRIIGGAKFA